MDNQLLNVKLLETAINTMARNRTLLFTINIIAALLLTVVYLERVSLDEKQRAGHLISYLDLCSDITKTLSSNEENTAFWNQLDKTEQAKFKKCSKPEEIRDLIASKATDSNLPENIKRQVSEYIFRLHRLKNDMDETKLENASAAPLGFGLSIPRNDLVMLAGFLLVILYMWLAFSFNQHARIITKIKLLFPENKFNEYNGNHATINDLVELNFLFHTNQRKSVTYLVRFLYFLAPLSMLIATANDAYSFFTATLNSKNYLLVYSIVAMGIKILITCILCVIGRFINKSDKVTNLAPKQLIKLSGLQLGMKKDEVSKVLNDYNAVKFDSDARTYKNPQNEKIISVIFNDEEVDKIEVDYSNKIKWANAEEFAGKLSQLYNLSIEAWQLEKKTNGDNNQEFTTGKIDFKDFVLSIDSETNKVILENTSTDEMELEKEKFKA